MCRSQSVNLEYLFDGKRRGDLLSVFRGMDLGRNSE